MIESNVTHDASGVLRLVEHINLKNQDVKSRRFVAGLEPNLRF
jgi:hypothetical protein